MPATILPFTSYCCDARSKTALLDFLQSYLIYLNARNGALTYDTIASANKIYDKKLSIVCEVPNHSGE